MDTTPSRFARLGQFNQQDEETSDLTLPDDLTALTDEEIKEALATAKANGAEIYGDGTRDFSDEDTEKLDALATLVDELTTEDAKREAALAERREKAASFAAKFQTEEPMEDPEPFEDPEPVVASAKVQVRTLSRRAAARRKTEDSEPKPPEIVRNFRTNDGKAATLTDMAAVIDKYVMNHNQGTYLDPEKRVVSENPIGAFQVGIPAERMILPGDSNDRIAEVLAFAANEHNTPKGGLVASGGWCAPSETTYELTPGLETLSGMLSAPEVGVSRGGLRWPKEISYAEIFANTGFSFTEEQDILGQYAVDGQGQSIVGPKPCYKVPCPEFDEKRLEVAGLCIKAGLLQSRAYPETIEHVIARALIAHAHKQNARKIGAMVAGATVVQMPERLGAVPALIDALQIQATHYRTLHRMSETATLEAVFPMHVLAILRSDVVRTQPVTDYALADAQIAGWIRALNVVPQFVYDWQDIGQNPAAGFTTWPATVDFLLYPAGAYVFATAGVVNMTNIFDSALLENNDYTALFTEEGWMAMKRRNDVRLVKVPMCPSGARSLPVELACTGIAA